MPGFSDPGQSEGMSLDRGHIKAAGWAALGLFVGLGPAASGRAHAEDALRAGFEIATQGARPDKAACSSCHGQNGAGQPDVGIPRLAGLTATYIEEQLGYFASGKRANYVMAGYAAALTPAQRKAVAAFYASLPLPQHADPITGDNATLDLGRKLFLNGDLRQGLLACSQCHGPDGLGVGTFSPRLAGQSAAYIFDQLQHWHDGSERDPKGQFMQAIAKHLDKASMQAVAAYAASLANHDEDKP